MSVWYRIVQQDSAMKVTSLLINTSHIGYVILMNDRKGQFWRTIRELLENIIFYIYVSFPGYLQQREKIGARAMLAKRQVCLANYSQNMILFLLMLYHLVKHHHIYNYDYFIWKKIIRSRMSNNIYFTNCGNAYKDLHSLQEKIWSVHKREDYVQGKFFYSPSIEWRNILDHQEVVFWE